MHVVFSLETGGLENGVVNLCNRLDPERFETTICVFREGGELESRVSRDRVDLVCQRRVLNNDPSLPFRLSWQLWRGKTDIVHTHSWGTLIEGTVAARLARTPVIIHGEHGVLETRPRNIRIQRVLWSRTQQVVAVSEELAERMSEVIGFGRSRIQAIPNGVDTIRFRPQHDRRTQLRQHFGLPDHAVVVGMVARLVAVKNHLGLIQAISQMKNSGTPVVLALAGDGPLRQELQAAATELGISQEVIFLGDVTRVDEFLNSLDVFVLNSHSEGMSNTILEAMASGLPVVATSVGAAPSLINDGESGLLVTPNDPAQLASALTTLAASSTLRSTMGTAARRRIEDCFSIDRMVMAHEELYERLTQARCRTSNRQVSRAK